ncbi:sulfotransferase family protein [Celeribacter sp.]|uniref:sulfotransferase family protein n=1 Tax=Celeribacter sp. TaxID=1890673 RepID=UPI003A9533A9
MSEPAPIILIGAARSGTKFLRDVLASGRGTAAVPYDVNYVWRYGAEAAPDDILDPATLTEPRKRFIRKTLRSLAKAAPDDILIEKTVANTLRVPFVEAVFPNARYVHLIREGRDVTESAMRQWRQSPDWSALLRKLRQIPIRNLGYVAWFGLNLVKGLLSGRKGGKVWGPRFPDIDTAAVTEPLSKVCARQWLASYTQASRDLARINGAESRVFTIRYEDLIRDDAALAALIDHLDLPDKGTIMATYRAKLRPSSRRTTQALPPEDQTTIEAVLAPTLTKLGYMS